jgi:hypothetical protein
MIFEVQEDLFINLNKAINKHQKDIEYIANGGISKTLNYDKAINNFKKLLEVGIEENTSINLNELIYITNEMAINKKFIEEIPKNSFDELIKIISQFKKLTLYKNIIKIFLNHYSTLHSQAKIEIVSQYINYILNIYNGNNKLLKICQHNKKNLFDTLELLKVYNYNIDDVKKDLLLFNEAEYILSMLNYKIVQRLEQLGYDEKNIELFNEILTNKEIIFKDNYNLKEYVVKELLIIVKNRDKPFPNWQKFILELIGDPRSTSKYNSNRSSWNAIGDEFKNYFIKSLSKEDLKLFLDTLSDSVSDTNYHYRKAFWMAFKDYVVFVKLIVGRNAYDGLDMDRKKHFKQDDGCYSRYKQRDQSAIYIDFGKIKIIEFTHNGSVRGYNECPIDLNLHFYSQDELTRKKHQVFSQPHMSPKTYTWQNDVLKKMNQFLGTNIKEKDIYIDSDKKNFTRYTS